MLTRIRFSALCLFVFASTNQPFAQTYKREDAPELLKNPAHNVVATEDGGYIDFTGSGDDKVGPAIVRFDKKLKTVYNREVPMLAGKKLVGTKYYRGKLFVYSLFDGDIIRTQVDDKTGSPEGSSTKLYSIGGNVYSSHFRYGSSLSQSFYYQLTDWHTPRERRSEKNFIGVILDATGAVLTKFSYTTSEEHEDIKSFSAVQSDDGSLYIIYGVKLKKSKEEYRVLDYTVLQVATNGKITTRNLSLPEGNIQNLEWRSKGSDLVFSGLLAKSKRDDFTVFLQGTFNTTTGKTDVHQLEIGQLPFMQQTTVPYLKKIATAGLPILISYDTTFSYKDGSYALVYEENGGYDHQSYFGTTSSNGMSPNTPSYSVPILTRGSIYIIKVNADNVPQWIKMVDKDQMEPDLNIFIGMTCTSDQQENLHFFFYDITSNKNAEPNGSRRASKVGAAHVKGNTLACVMVKPDGSMSKQFLDDEDNYEVHISPERSGGLRSNQLAYIAIRKRGMAFTSDKLFNNAEYRFGVITIN